MAKLALEVLIIFLLLVANGIFAMAETAVISARKARLQRLANAGDYRARAALRLTASTSQFLATVQIGITLIGILAGVFGGATITEEIAAFFERFPRLAPYSETIGVSVVVLGITYASLILGELVPKRLAMNNPERIASMMAAPMHTLSRIAAPVVQLLNVSTDLVIRLMGIKPTAEPTITLEELRILLQHSRESGAIEISEHDMLMSVLQLDERRVAAFMTPRTQVVALDVDDSPARIRDKIAASQQAQFLVVKGSLDNLVGIVRAVDLLNQSLAGEPIDLIALIRPPLYVPESISALKMLELFRQEGRQIALVTDEYGGIEGVVSHKDVLEDLAGYISSTSMLPKPQATHQADGAWLLDGLLHVDEFKQILGIPKIPDETRSLYQTVGGFVMTHLQAVPGVGQSFEWRGLRFEVVEMDGHRVDKVLVTPTMATPRQAS